MHDHVHVYFHCMKELYLLFFFLSKGIIFAYWILAHYFIFPSTRRVRASPVIKVIVTFHGIKL